jgi:hypothetical protein
MVTIYKYKKIHKAEHTESFQLTGNPLFFHQMVYPQNYVDKKHGRITMKNRKPSILSVFLATTLMVTSMAWGQKSPPQDGAIFGSTRVVTSLPGKYELLHAYGNSLSDYNPATPQPECGTDIYDTRLRACSYAALQECYAQLAVDLPDYQSRPGVSCFLTQWCRDSTGSSGSYQDMYSEHPSINGILERWTGECADNWALADRACACVVSHLPYIDGAQEDDVLFYLVNGLPTEDLTDEEEAKREIISAFFTTAWPNYGTAAPYHVAYCSESMNPSEYQNDLLATGNICTEIFDNRAVLDMNSYTKKYCTGLCDGGIFGLGPLWDKDDCCCDAEWLDHQGHIGSSDERIYLAEELTNLIGVYEIDVRRHKPIYIPGEFRRTYSKFAYQPNMDSYYFNDGTDKIFTDAEIDTARNPTAGTGYRLEHNYGTVLAFQLLADAAKKQQLHDHMDDLDANPWRYNFGGYSELEYQAGCSQTMGDTLEHVGLMTTCQGYNATYISACELGGPNYSSGEYDGGIINTMFFAFKDLCLSLVADVDSGDLNYCLGRSKSEFCSRMSAAITFAFMNETERTAANSTNDSSKGVYLPTPRAIAGVTAPADLLERIWGTPGNECGGLARDPAAFGCSGQRCLCTGEAYCWCDTENDNWCPLDWHDGCDGCDQGCQFTDPDCWGPTYCANYSSSQNKPLQCGNDRCDPGEDISNCGKDCAGHCYGESQCGWNFCCSSSPCIEGQGDCDSDAECLGNLTCGTDNGARYGCDPIADVCFLDLGGGCYIERQCGWRFCCSSSPCKEGGGDCDSDAECASGLICGTDNGATYGCDPSVDICIPGGAQNCPAIVAGTTYGSTTGESDDFAISCAAGGGVDYCYSWTAYSTGTYTIDTCSSGTNYDSALAIFSEDGSTQLACNDDGSDCTNYRSKISFSATSGVTYTIVVDGYLGDFGDYELTITAPSGGGGY